MALLNQINFFYLREFLEVIASVANAQEKYDQLDWQQYLRADQFQDNDWFFDLHREPIYEDEEYDEQEIFSSDYSPSFAS